VFPAHQDLEIRVDDSRIRNDVKLALDGQRVFNLKCGDKIHVRRSSYKLNLLQNPRIPYFRLLKEKMSWGER